MALLVDRRCNTLVLICPVQLVATVVLELKRHCVQIDCYWNCRCQHMLFHHQRESTAKQLLKELESASIHFLFTTGNAYRSTQNGRHPPSTVADQTKLTTDI